MNTAIAIDLYIEQQNEAEHMYQPTLVEALNKSDERPDIMDWDFNKKSLIEWELKCMSF